MPRGRPRLHAESAHEPRWTLNNEEIVAWLLAQYPQVRKGRIQFLRDIEDAFHETRGELLAFRRVPDAYAIFPKQRLVDLFEVEVTHPVQRSTMLHYGKLWFALDTFDITLTLHIVNRYGHIAPLDVQRWYYTLLTEDLKDVDLDWNSADSGTPGGQAAGGAGSVYEAAGFPGTTAAGRKRASALERRRD